MSVLDSLREAFRVARDKNPGFTEDMSEGALLEILAALGGERVVIPKTMRGRPGRPGHSEEAKAQAYRDALTSATTAEITSRTGVSRTVLYRLMKRGPPRGGER